MNKLVPVKYPVLIDFGLFFGWLIFLVIASIFGVFALIVGILLLLGSSYFVWRTFQSRQFVHAVIGLLLAMSGLRFMLFPLTHSGFTYDEQHKIVLVPHKHYIWEMDHVH